MKSYASNGIILKRRDFSEADRILTVYSKDFGKLSLIARGVKKPESKKRGHLEVFNHIKFSAVKGSGLDIMTEVEIIDAFESIRGELKKISVAYYLVEVIDRVAAGKNEELYDLLISSLGDLKTTTQTKSLRLNFVSQALVILGFWPHNEFMDDPDLELEKVVERKLFTPKIGKKVLKSSKHD